MNDDLKQEIKAKADEAREITGQVREARDQAIADDREVVGYDSDGEDTDVVQKLLEIEERDDRNITRHENYRDGIDEDSDDYHISRLQQELTSVGYSLDSLNIIIEERIIPDDFTEDGFDVEEAKQRLDQVSEDLIVLGNQCPPYTSPPPHEESDDVGNPSNRGSLLDDYADHSSEPFDVMDD